VPNQIVQQRPLVEWSSLCFEGPGFRNPTWLKILKRKEKGHFGIGMKKITKTQKVDFDFEKRLTSSSTSFVGKQPLCDRRSWLLVEVQLARLERQRLNTFSKEVDHVQSNLFLHFNPSLHPQQTPHVQFALFRCGILQVSRK
jgi:hypothetical protein